MFSEQAKRDKAEVSSRILGFIPWFYKSSERKQEAVFFFFFCFSVCDKRQLLLRAKRKKLWEEAPSIMWGTERGIGCSSCECECVPVCGWVGGWGGMGHVYVCTEENLTNKL